MARARSRREIEYEGVSEALDYDARKAGGGVAAMAWIAAFGWIGGGGVLVNMRWGLDKLADLPPELLASLAAGAIVPALLILFAGAAARETARARAQSTMLSAAAEKMLNPAPTAEAASRRLGAAVRAEIDTLERAIDQAMAKAREVEAIISRQTQHLDGKVLAGMERERAALLQIAQDLNSQASDIGTSISRHARAIEEAAVMARNEIAAADDTLSARLSSFGDATARIADRSGTLTRAAEVSADSAHRLNQVIGGALDALAQATSLTDAARKSAEQATFAANNTAGAVRETTSRAVEDAKRAAEIIRGEAVNVEQQAASALERLREAADIARDAAANMRTVASGAPETVRQAKAAPPPISRSADFRAPEQRNEVRIEPRNEPRRTLDPPLPRASEPAPRITVAPRPPNDPPAGQQWTWREVLASADDQPLRSAPPEPRRAASSGVGANAALAHTHHPIAVVNVIEAAGLTLAEIFEVSALDRVAQRARNGTQARRRAVADAAPDAVNRLSTLLNRDSSARTAANEFLSVEGPRISELLGRGRASMGADATRAFLLIDAASA